MRAARTPQVSRAAPTAGRVADRRRGRSAGAGRVELLEALKLDPTDREAFEAVRGLGD